MTWNDVSTQAEEIEISRVYDGTIYTQIAVLSMYAKSYSDYDGTPGVNYHYKVIPVKSGVTFIADFDYGSKKENGAIKGKVVSNLNVGVSGVTVTANGNLPSGINEFTIDTKDLTSGVYYCVATLNGQVIQEVMIKQ
ncbi:hypothetical protein N8368_02405 [Bacteroidia bacterium]|nr:hypothetical protein [Bacteroidia bacterium]MDB4107281.1 hypothetical protein [Bacteroidia bacterium]MDB9882403.1 hypothetical protein [Bacteroidia bacterium]MDC1395340.1 hypothetical protein [Bacteroidia bacterium]